MQVALCVIFAGSVALAALVTHERRALGDGTELTGSHGELGPIRQIVVPSGWVHFPGRGPVVFRAQEPDRTDHDGRTLTCSCTRLAGAVSPLEYLQATLLAGPRVRIISQVQEINMCGVTGALLAIDHSSADGFQWIACCVLPSGWVITLLLDCPGNDLNALNEDGQTLQDIAASIELRN